MSDGIKLTIKQVPLPPQHTWVLNPVALVYLDPKQEWSISGTNETLFNTSAMKLKIKQNKTEMTLSGEVESMHKHLATLDNTPYREIQCPVAFKVTTTYSAPPEHQRQVSFIVGAQSDGRWFFAVI